MLADAKRDRCSDIARLARGADLHEMLAAERDALRRYDTEAATQLRDHRRTALEDWRGSLAAIRDGTIATIARSLERRLTAMAAVNEAAAREALDAQLTALLAVLGAVGDDIATSEMLPLAA